MDVAQDYRYSWAQLMMGTVCSIGKEEKVLSCKL